MKLADIHIKLIDAYDDEDWGVIEDMIKEIEIELSTGNNMKENILTIQNIVDTIEMNNRIIGVGETGLDFYYNHSDIDSQKKSFLKHIHASQETSSTLIVHSRSAEKETLDILSSEIKNKNFKVLMHCFTGSKEFAHKLLDIGCYFSASGIITFKNSQILNEVFKSIPKNKILIETDSPYLSPEPNRGKVNEPSFVKYTAEYLAKFFKLSLEEFEKITDNNFFNLFTKAKRDNYL